jgi:uncharacterized membrane protein
MTNYVAVVFDTEAKADTALKALWQMDEDSKLTVHGASIVKRDDSGHVQVSSKHTDLGMRTAIGVGVGVLLGALAGPIGIAAGVAGAATLATGTAVGVGAAAGAAVGLTSDVVKATHRHEQEESSFFVLKPGQHAVLAEVSEDWASVLDDAMKALGGTVHRRPDTVMAYSPYGQGYYSNYMYPYYVPAQYY